MNSFSEVLISKQNLLHNLGQFKKIAGKAKIITVVKSNAYGHGIDLVAPVIEKSTDWFATVNLDEALYLRKLGIKKPILVLSYYHLDQVAEAIKQNISLVVYEKAQVMAMQKAARRLKKQARVHIKLDTGASRLGILIRDLLDFAEYIQKSPELEIEGIFSHFASSEEDLQYTRGQINLFELALLKLSAIGVKPQVKHIACTAAALTFKNSHYNAVRVGIGLYGLWPSKKAYKETRKLYPKLTLKPVLTWQTQIVQVKALSKGTYIGYGKTYQTKKDTILAVLPVGYYEGYDRGFSNNGDVLVRGKRCLIRGRICMNLMMVDVTDVKGVRVGDEAVLIGKQGSQEITAEQLAGKLTINYEVVARISSAVPRILK
jgi:alanine racemase